MIDLPSFLDAVRDRLAKATPFCTCQIVVRTVVAGNSTSSPATANTIDGGHQLIQCETHREALTDLARLLAVVEVAVEIMEATKKIEAPLREVLKDYRGRDRIVHGSLEHPVETDCALCDALAHWHAAVDGTGGTHGS